MKIVVFRPGTMWVRVTLACVLSVPASAELITNGGFEMGFTGWTRSNQVGSEGQFALQTGTQSPVNLFTVPAPPEGTTATAETGTLSTPCPEPGVAVGAPAAVTV